MSSKLYLEEVSKFIHKWVDYLVSFFSAEQSQVENIDPYALVTTFYNIFRGPTLYYLPFQMFTFFYF